MQMWGRAFLVAGVALGLSACGLGGPTVPTTATATVATDPRSSASSEEDFVAGAQSLAAERLPGFERRLSRVLGAEVDAAVPPYVSRHGALCGRLDFLLPLDHRSETSPKISIDVEVCEIEPTAAVVFQLPGYGELTSAAAFSNTIVMTHRLAEGATQEQLPYLTGWQAASDAHAVHDAVVDALGWRDRWLVEGMSKGGAAALFYRFYYEDDSAGVIAYSSILNPGNKRQPYVAFAASGGDMPECFAQIKALQMRMLSDEQTYVEAYAPSRAVQLGEVFTDLTAEFEFIVASLPTFVMRQADPGPVCAELPGPEATPQAVVRGVLDARERYERERLSYEAGWSQEHAAYLGWSELTPVDAEVAALMTHPEVLTQPLVPRDGPRPIYDPAESMALWRWLTTRATRVLFVDGANDVMAANRPDADPEREILRVAAARRGHGGFDTLTDSDWDAFDRTSDWLDTDS